MSKLVIQRGLGLDNWGTPPEVLNLVHAVFGVIDIDLASNPEANKLVCAKRFYSNTDPCPTHVPTRTDNTVWCNPPGPVLCVCKFWDIWVDTVKGTGRGAFLLWNLDHWRSLSRQVYLPNLLQCIIWKSRLRFMGAPSQFHHPSALILYGASAIETPHGHVVRW